MYLALPAVLLAGCGENKTEVDKTVKNPDSTSHTVTQPKNNKPEVVDGEYIEKYPGGEIKIKGEMASGMRKGQWIAYYPDGTKQSESHYEDGKKNGKTATYYPNGKLRYLGYYSWEKPIGKWEFYNEDGTLNTTKEYDNN